MRFEEWPIASRNAQLLLVALLVSAAEAPIEGPAVSRAQRSAGARMLERLKQLSLVELERAAATASLELIVRLDADRVAWSAHAAARGQEEQALLKYFVRHGATRSLLRELFGVSRQRVTEIRRAQRLRSAQGRPKLPPRKVRDAIEAAWTRLARAFKDTRSRLYELHREFPQYSFATLDAVVRESASLAPDLSTPPGKRRRGEPVSPELERASTRAATPRVPIVHRRDPE